MRILDLHWKKWVRIQVIFFYSRRIFKLFFLFFVILMPKDFGLQFFCLYLALYLDPNFFCGSIRIRIQTRKWCGSNGSGFRILSTNEKKRCNIIFVGWFACYFELSLHNIRGTKNWISNIFNTCGFDIKSQKCKEIYSLYLQFPKIYDL